jgi:hypothetical protein
LAPRQPRMHVLLRDSPFNRDSPNDQGSCVDQPAATDAQNGDHVSNEPMLLKKGS